VWIIVRIRSIRQTAQCPARSAFVYQASLKQSSRELSDSKRMFGSKDQVDPMRHLIGTELG
jgi:hypothetical protein